MAPRWPAARRRLAHLAPLLALVAQGERPPAALGCAAKQRAADHEPAAVATIGDDDPVRVKGLRPRLLIDRKRGATIERLEHAALARQGDLVQISYVAAGNRHGVILSLDDRGVVTLHHPLHVGAATGIVMRGEQALGHAYELDDAGFERFVFVTSGELPLDVQAVVHAAQDLARSRSAEDDPLALPSPWQQTSLTLAKVAPDPP